MRPPTATVANERSTPATTRPTGQPVPRETATAGGTPVPSTTTRPPEPASTYGGSSYGTPSTSTSSTQPRPVGQSVPQQPQPQPVGKPVQSPETAATKGMVEPHANSARESCGKRVFVALAICMDERCEDPRWRNSAECIPILQRKRQREQQGG